MALKSVTSLTVPCSLAFQDCFRPGMGVRIRGSVPCGSQWFSVDFSCGEEPNCYIAFHFKPHFDQNCVVFNSFQNHGWQSEQVMEGNPFKHGASFLLEFYITDQHFEVVVNKKVFGQFKHRIPLCGVKVLEINPEVQIQKIELF
ncbi:galectin-7-like isoform X2 [Alligator mississippiensis]|uniref:galectin-7-like isoform X2 n=1 Tax=Alligator mississippiensis TaxID=8496 RepID=UPI002877B5DC|nr:galectin-7-like isoform X2 [Alligator mississippiensis]